MSAVRNCFDQNLILTAGAGTGKTHALITIGLQLLAGLRARGPVAPEKLWAVTFTEKAAAELRQRLRQRAQRLAVEERGPDEEPELWAAAEEAGVAFPGPARWAEIASSVAACNVSTIHGACATLLRELPSGAGAGLGAFETWDAPRSLTELREAARAAVLAPGAPLGTLLEDLSLSAGSPFSKGLIDLLAAIQEQLGEDGLSISRIPPPAPTPSVVEALGEWRRAFTALVASRPGHDRAPRLRRALDRLPGDPAGLGLVWGLMKAAVKGLRRQVPAQAAAQDAHEGLTAALGEARAASHWQDFLALAGATEERYRAVKERAGALDFNDLCARARNLLRDDLVARRAAHERVGAVLLDETQDTNRVQLELVLLLCEQRGALLPLDQNEDLVDRLSLEPGTLCAVGDRKQSIYEFRGADVAVFDRLARALVAGGGAQKALQSCRRSRPELVAFFNAFFGRVMARGGAAFEVAFDPGVDAVTALRPAAGERLVELLSVEGETAKERRAAEAEALASHLSRLIANPPDALRDEVGGVVRPGHCALLLRRLTFVEVFRDALARHGLPSTLVGGEGFFGSQEIFDASALLSVCATPDDWLATLTLLRSPICGASDDAAVLLHLSPPRGLSISKLWKSPLPAQLSEGDARKLAGLGRWLRPLVEAGEVASPGRLLDLVEETLGPRGWTGQAQAAANLDKLRSMVAAWEGDGEGLTAVAERLARLCREGQPEPLAPALDEADLSAVRVMTVHQAKGLEFPVVAVAECGSVRPMDNSPVAWARGAGFGVKARELDGAWYSTEAYQRAHREQESRSAAEYLRIFYVACTRAKERLIFSGELPSRNGSGCWRELLDGEPSVVRIDARAFLGAGDVAHPISATRSEVSIDEAAAALAATEPIPPASPTRLEMTTTGAADRVLCPRRYQLRQLWRWPDRIGRHELPEDLPTEGGPRQLGSYAHRLLELVDLSLAALDPAAAVERAARKVWAKPEERREVGGEVQALLASAFGRRLCALPPERVWREREFALRVGSAPDLILRGSIDLLCLLDGKALVIDYKRGPPRLEPSYRAQVELYALAASRLLGGHLPVEGGLWFLKDPAEGPGLWAIGAERLREIEDQLRQVASELLSAPDPTTPWPGLEAASCRTLGCGYVNVCHPAAAV